MKTTKPSASAAPHPYIISSSVVVGIMAISLASILIRLADAPANTTAAYRVALATIAMVPFFLYKHRKEKADWHRKTVQATILSGCFLSLHFVFWISSLQLTSIASSVSLASTTPLFVALFSYGWLRQRPSLRLGLAIICTTIGSALVAGIDFSLSSRALRGDLLAILGAVMAAGYLMAGQYARRSLDLSAYALGAYGTAALVLLAGCRLTGSPLFGFSRETYIALVLLALVPQLIGHTTFNWTLRFLPPAAVSLLILGEPLGATLLAYLVFGETVSGLKGFGLLLLGAGIVLGSQGFRAQDHSSVEVDSRHEKQ